MRSSRKGLGVAALKEGDIVVLVSGSPKFAVEKLEGRKIHCIWCHEGAVHRDVFDAALVRKWDAAPSDGRKRGDDYHSKDRPPSGRGGKPHSGGRFDNKMDKR